MHPRAPDDRTALFQPLVEETLLQREVTWESRRPPLECDGIWKVALSCHSADNPRGCPLTLCSHPLEQTLSGGSCYRNMTAKGAQRGSEGTAEARPWLCVHSPLLTWPAGCDLRALAPLSWRTLSRVGHRHSWLHPLMGRNPADPAPLRSTGAVMGPSAGGSLLHQKSCRQVILHKWLQLVAAGTRFAPSGQSVGWLASLLQV